ncbi:MAG: sigma-54-dependent Fis family transcriptional regulator [Planctomycetes bacterium]|nr:sigma-54-dependent Fis family transcriptional regulator [Planctomycetota bacterium]
MYIKCMAKKSLTPSQKNYLSLVKQAVMVNPFGQQRREVYRKLAGLAKPKEIEVMIPLISSQIQKRFAAFDKDTPARIDEFQDDDQPLIKHLFLFDMYNRCFEAFDRLIEVQIQKPTKNLPVPFAREILNQINQRGLPLDEACRYFAIFYQLRRSFYFIEAGLIGQSECMQQFRMKLWNNIFTHDHIYYEEHLWSRMEDFSTLLLGPTGAGKGAAAAAIGRCGFIPFDPKSQKFVETFTSTFIPMNLSQYAQTLLESELFGHTKGAFTGAVQDHTGLFARCSRHGSIFLDEIGDVSIPVQIKLLKVLDERLFSPVGSFESLRFNGRVIAATHRSLTELRQSGRFRNDFFYRLCSDIIEVPTLKERLTECPDELPDLIDHTIGKVVGHRSSQMTQTVMEVIEKRLGPDYDWPGNVRELAQCVRRVIVKRDYEGDIDIGGGDNRPRFIDDMSQGRLDAKEVLNGYCALLYRKHKSYEKVAKKTGLDRRTVKKYIESCK